MEFLTVLAFAAALSLDGLGAGIAYGIRKIRIPILSLIIISLTSSTAVGISMFSGHMVSRYISPQAADVVGAAILIAVGLWIIIQTWSSAKKNSQAAAPLETETTVIETAGQIETILKLKIKSLGLVVQVLREPTAADIDRSGIISKQEAVLLGLALALDALSAGFGAAMTGFNYLLTPICVGVVKFTFLALGGYCGRRYAVNWLGDRAASLPGWVLIFLGVLRVIKI